MHRPSETSLNHAAFALFAKQKRASFLTCGSG